MRIDFKQTIFLQNSFGRCSSNFELFTDVSGDERPQLSPKLFMPMAISEYFDSFYSRINFSWHKLREHIQNAELCSTNDTLRKGKECLGYLIRKVHNSEILAV